VQAGALTKVGQAVSPKVGLLRQKAGAVQGSFFKRKDSTVHDSSHFWQVQIIVVMQLCMYVHVLILCCAKQKGEDGPVLHN
jgi:hypothetical protein